MNFVILKILDNIVRIFRTSYAGYSFWLVGGQGGQAIAAFLSNLILVRYLSPQDFGRFAVTYSIVGLTVATFGLRIGTILMQASGTDLKGGGKNTYFSALVAQTILVSTSSLILLWFFRLWNLWAMMLLLNMLTEPWVSSQKVLYERKFHYKNLSLLELGSNLACHLFAILGVIGGLGPSVLYFRGWIETIGRLGGLAMMGGLSGFRLRLLSLEEWRFLFRKIRGYWLEGWLRQAFDRLIIISLGALEGSQITGYFFQARRLAITPNQLFEPVSDRILFNFLSNRVSPKNRIPVLEVVLSVQIPVLVLIGVVSYIVADPVIPWIFGPGWKPVIPLFQAMVGVVIGMTPFYTLGIYFKSHNYMWPFTIFGQGFQYVSLGVVLALGLLIGLTPPFGMALGLSVGYLGGLCLVAFLLKVHQKRFKEIGAIVIK